MISELKNNKQVLIELFLLSVVSLYFELLSIRWISADFVAFTVFKTFPLVTCFVGLGVGFAAQKNQTYFRLAPLAVLQFVLFLQLGILLGFDVFFFPSVGVWQWVDPKVFVGSMLWVYVAIFTLLLIVVLSGAFATMVCLGARLGQLFNQTSPLTAYSVNIGGSIVGSLLFSMLTFMGFPPWILLCPAAILIACYTKNKLWQSGLIVAVTLALAAIPNTKANEQVYWSPYQKLSVYPFKAGNNAAEEAIAGKQGIVIGTSTSFYQYCIDLRESSLNNPSLPASVRAKLEEHSRHYNLPYKLKTAKSVLVLGAGSGNDVAAALRNGAEHVDAVDIDPVILSLGEKNHLEQPYQSPKVTRHCDDARSFLNKCTTKYDLIIFAGLDSHTITGSGGSIRLDNYVYTKESMQRALELLNPDNGLMIVSFCQSKPWLTERLYSTIASSCGYAPVTVVDNTNPFLAWQIFICGPEIQKKKLVIDEASIAPFKFVDLAPKAPVRILTDDWPFVYVSPVIIDVPYLFVVFIILLLSAIAARKVLTKSSPPSSWQMFFLGAAFLLLELQSIARLSLLFGSTWYTSAVVINAVLIMILGANVLVIKLGDKIASRLEILYGALLAALLISYALPMNTIMLSMNGAVAVSLVTLLTVLPMFLAGLIFSTSFGRVKEPDKAFAFNLLGAVVGAMLEYLSNFIGINGLVLIAIGLYALSFAAIRREKISSKA